MSKGAKIAAAAVVVVAAGAFVGARFLTPESAPEAITAISLTLPTRIPAASTAWGLSPQARRCSPNLVL